MICLGSVGNNYLFYDHDGYYVQQLIGGMLSERVIDYKLTKEEENSYRLIGLKALNPVLDHFYKYENHSDLNLSERQISSEKRASFFECRK
ncbi:hypothetical protein VSA01S_38470 [Vibrio sagamiensis NBRC 104589]|uniref:Uncharacterized protein n=2 Tax=Vibrio sagamiensis TaxID=512650 RepID=A0A511QK71_9VIBR|nr:hypothetical protein VSA01S_38470 [Vibrio sagamiensis NBRC 104589]